jgi:hypothetical protein
MEVPPDIIKLIADFLAPLYKILFAQVNRTTYKYIKVDIQSDLRERFKCIDNVLASGGVIIGPFLLDYLLGTTLNRVDIFYPHTDMLTAMHHHFNLAEICKGPAGIIEDNSALFIRNDKYIVILCGDCSSEEYVARYPYDFCKIIYDGQLKVQSIHSLITMSSQERPKNMSTACYIEWDHDDSDDWNNLISAEEIREIYTSAGFKIFQ